MSKLAQFLKSTVGAANPANPDASSRKISNFSNISTGVSANSFLPGDLEARIRTMAKRWGYSSDELAEALAGAKTDPGSWLAWTERDDRDFGGCVTAEDFAAQYVRVRGLA
jgi:hypothetical protein